LPRLRRVTGEPSAANLAHADAAGDPAPVLISLGAKIKVGSKKGEKVYDLGEFYTDLFETAMEHDEMVLEVQVPPMAPKTACAYKKFTSSRTIWA